MSLQEPKNSPILEDESPKLSTLVDSKVGRSNGLSLSLRLSVVHIGHTAAYQGLIVRLGTWRLYSWLQDF